MGIRRFLFFPKSETLNGLYGAGMAFQPVGQARNDYDIFAGIAERLYLSPKTVANYLTSIFAKLAVSDRGQAIITARDAGLGRGG